MPSLTTTWARAWAVTRSDGTIYGFTDHDQDLTWDGITFAANSGLTAQALERGTGLAVDNSAAIGALQDARLNEADIAAGRFDGAEVELWQVDWSDPSNRILLFRGSLGEIEWTGGQFKAELRGLSEALNQPRGRIYQPRCSAILGDDACGVDLSLPLYRAEGVVRAVAGATITVDPLAGYVGGWFAQGQLQVLTGAAEGLSGLIKADELGADERRITLWQEIRADLEPGDQIALIAGCNRSGQTCREKFDNFRNFRGFPHLPGDDWITTYPAQGEDHSGGAMMWGDR